LLDADDDVHAMAPSLPDGPNGQEQVPYQLRLRQNIDVKTTA
jgi:hypothetical protein